ncbi:hypothetical protein ABK040_012134 [Willaertia magna]
MSSLNPGCINSINFTAVSAAQFAVNIPSVEFPYIYTNTIRTLKGSICSGFTASQLGQLILSQCTNIQKECSQYIPKSAFSSIATNCLLSNDAISVLSKDQISFCAKI